MAAPVRSTRGIRIVRDGHQKIPRLVERIYSITIITDKIQELN
jgi:hypothetical protein